MSLKYSLDWISAAFVSCLLCAKKDWKKREIGSKNEKLGVGDSLFGWDFLYVVG